MTCQADILRFTGNSLGGSATPASDVHTRTEHGWLSPADSEPRLGSGSTYVTLGNAGPGGTCTSGTNRGFLTAGPLHLLTQVRRTACVRRSRDCYPGMIDRPKREALIDRYHEFRGHQNGTSSTQ
ncbi:hypothetical protein VTK26DRAFT_3072 [Humicola hyalothermophila]